MRVRAALRSAEKERGSIGYPRRNSGSVRESLEQVAEANIQLKVRLAHTSYVIKANSHRG